MAKKLENIFQANVDEISQGFTINSWHVSQSVDAFTAEDAYDMQKKGEAIIIDVRTSIEFIYTGHGEGFINIPYHKWTYENRSIKTRVDSAAFEIKNEKVKSHKQTIKLYKAKESFNPEFVKEVMQAMKMRSVNSVILVCRSGPRAKVAADKLEAEGITAYNLDGGFIFGWKPNQLPWGGE